MSSLPPELVAIVEKYTKPKYTLHIEIIHDSGRHGQLAMIHINAEIFIKFQDITIGKKIFKFLEITNRIPEFHEIMESIDKEYFIYDKIYLPKNIKIEIEKTFYENIEECYRSFKESYSNYLNDADHNDSQYDYSITSGYGVKI